MVESHENSQQHIGEVVFSKFYLSWLQVLQKQHFWKRSLTATEKPPPLLLHPLPVSCRSGEIISPNCANKFCVFLAETGGGFTQGSWQARLDSVLLQVFLWRCCFSKQSCPMMSLLLSCVCVCGELQVQEKIASPCNTVLTGIPYSLATVRDN